MQLQRLTNLMGYPDGGILVDQVLFDKIVTCMNDAQLRQKLYKEGKGLTMEKALHIIRIYGAKQKAQDMTVNYLKDKGKVPGKDNAQPNNNKKQGSQRGKPQHQGNKDKCGKCRKGTQQ